MTRKAAVPSALVLCTAFATACSDVGAPRVSTPGNLSGLVVSQPVSRSSAASRGMRALASGSAALGGVVYVSLVPGSVPPGFDYATIRDQQSGQNVGIPVVNGGFDPVAVAASLGDTLAVDITRGYGQPIHTIQLVRAGRPPVVVRTSPPRKQPDVPLNALMVIVFSVPMDSAALLPDSVRLYHGTTSVAGSARFTDASHLEIGFQPDSLLVPETDYRLVVAPGVRDVDGLPLAQGLEVPFTTGRSVQAATGMAFTRQPTSTTVGVAFTPAVTVTIQDSSGNTVTGAVTVTLGLGANPVAGTLSGTLTVTAVAGVATFPDLSLDRPGSYTLTASAGGLATATSATFTVFVGGRAFRTVSAGGDHTCGITYVGEAYCWGANDHGQLGDGTTTARTSPVRVSGAAGFVAVMAGGSHTCALAADGQAYCWGLNNHGQVGDGTTTDRSAPVPVSPGLQFANYGLPGIPVGLSAGENHTCGVALLSDGSGAVYCWGANASGQLDDGTTTDRWSPVLAARGIDVVSAGGQHTCGVDLWTAGAGYCWGSNTSGQLGDGTNLSRTGAVDIQGISCGRALFTPPGCPAGADLAIKEVAAGGGHTCAEAGNTWFCWGANSYGQVGDGTTTDRPSPVPMTALPFLTEDGTMSPGGRHTCGLTANGAYCWGDNSAGQLGDGTTTLRTVPVLVVGGLSFLSLSSGGGHTCGVTAGGAYCWGANGNGQLGNGTTTDSGVPVKIAGQQ